MRLLRALSTPALNVSRGGTFTASLSNPFQCFTTLIVKNFFLISSLNLPSLSLKLLFLVLSRSPFAQTAWFRIFNLSKPVGYLLASSFFLQKDRAGSSAAAGSWAKRCCVRGSCSSRRNHARRGTRTSPPLLLSYRFPFLRVSLKIGWINILPLASAKAPELQKVCLIHACDHSRLTSELFLFFF